MSNRIFDSIEACIIGIDCRYDMIIRKDAIQIFKLNLLFKENIIEMEDISIPMRPFPENKMTMFSIAETMLIEMLEQELENEFSSITNDLDDIKNLPQDSNIDDSETDTKDAFISEIKPAHYEAMRPEEVLQSCLHLNKKRRIREI